MRTSPYAAFAIGRSRGQRETLDKPCAGRRTSSPDDQLRRSCLARTVLAVVAALAALVLSSSPAGAQTAPEIEWIDGADTYEVAVAAVGGNCGRLADSHGSVALALATGENWPDALAASALDRPLLLSGRASLHPAVRQFVQGCPASVHIVILGGIAAISQEVEDELVALGASVQRIAGADRYETARKVAEFAAPSQVSQVYLATGANFADAIAAAPRVIASTPIILTPKAGLGADASAFLSARLPSNGTVVILGGTAAVSQAVHDRVRELKLSPRRIAGADRYSTAALIARESLSDPRCDPVTDIAVASGTDPYGGLAAASVRNPCQPLLLAPRAGASVPKAVADFAETWADVLASQTGLTGTVTAVGSRAALANDWVDRLTGNTPTPVSAEPVAVTEVSYLDDLVRDDRVILPAVPSATSTRAQSSTGDLRVKIHACVQPELARYVAIEDLEVHAEFLNEHEAPWFAWQSSERLSIRFETGSIIVSQDLARLKVPGPGRESGRWGSYVAPPDCIAPETAADGNLHHYLVVGTDFGGPCDGTGELGGAYSSTYFRFWDDERPRRGGYVRSTLDRLGFRQLMLREPGSVISGVMYNIVHRSADTTLSRAIDHLWGSSFYHADAQLGGSVDGSAFADHWLNPDLIVGSFAGFPDSDTLVTTYDSAHRGIFQIRRTLPCALMRGLGWPTGTNRPACHRLTPPRPGSPAILNEPDGNIRATWQPPPGILNPEPVTGYRVRVFRLMPDGSSAYRSISDETTPLADVTVPAATTAYVLPKQNVDGAAYSVWVSALSSVGEGAWADSVPIQFLPPVVQATATQRDTRGQEVSVGSSPTPIRNPIEFDLSWLAAPGASHYLVSGFESCTIRTEFDDGHGNTSFEACSQRVEGTSHSLTELRDQLVEGKSYDITVFACGDIYDTFAVIRAAPSGCFRYASAAITATRLETPPSGKISVAPATDCFAANVCYKVSWTPHPDARAYAASYSWCADPSTQCDPLAAGLSTVIGDEAYSVTATEASTTLTIFTEDGPAQGGRYLVRVYACYASVDPHACWGSQGSWLVGETWVTIPDSGS